MFGVRDLGRREAGDLVLSQRLVALAAQRPARADAAQAQATARPARGSEAAPEGAPLQCRLTFT
jgi:hypothetical protein